VIGELAVVLQQCTVGSISGHILGGGNRILHFSLTQYKLHTGGFRGVRLNTKISIKMAMIKMGGLRNSSAPAAGTEAYL
jgi:hypothetical protein